MRKLSPSITVIQAKVIHCRRSTEIPWARGTIRSLKRCHCTISHCANAACRTLMILARRMYMRLLHIHSTSRIMTVDTQIYTLDFMTPGKKWRKIPCRDPLLVDALSTRVFCDCRVMFSLFSPRHPCQSDIKCRVP